MKKLLLLYFLLLVSPVLFAQDAYDSTKVASSEELFLRSKQANYKYLTPGQPYLVLDVNPALGGFYRVRDFEGERFKFKASAEAGKQKVNIYSIADSSFTHVTYSEAARDFNYYPIRFDAITK